MAFEMAALGGIGGILTVVGFALGAIKVKKMGVAEGIMALVVILGGAKIVDIVGAIPVLGGLVAMLFALVTGFAVGAVVRAGLTSVLGKAGLKI